MGEIVSVSPLSNIKSKIKIAIGYRSEFENKSRRADPDSFRILITGEQSGLVETITDAVSVHSIKKGEYARRVAAGEAIGTVSLMDHFVGVSLDPEQKRAQVS